MSRRQKARRAGAHEPVPASRRDGVFLPEANPPRKRPVQLLVASTLLAAWLAFLGYLVLR